MWDRLRSLKFEERCAKTDLGLGDALQLLNCMSYFDLKGLGCPADLYGLAYYMEQEEVIRKQDNGLYAVTNLGAILFAKDLLVFPKISRKAIRVVQYEGNNRLSMVREEV